MVSYFPVLPNFWSPLQWPGSAPFTEDTFPLPREEAKMEMTHPIHNAQEDLQVAGMEMERTVRGTCSCRDFSRLKVRIPTSPWTSQENFCTRRYEEDE